jgi:hypothetical protein
MTKSLILAAVTALTLTTGAAMAQEQGGPSFAPTTWSAPRSVAPQSSQSTGLQFGGSDAIHNEDLGMKAFDAYNPYVGG